MVRNPSKTVGPETEVAPVKQDTDVASDIGRANDDYVKSKEKSVRQIALAMNFEAVVW